MLEFCAEPYSLRAAVPFASPIASPTKFQLNTLESHPCITRASNPFGMIFLQKKVGGRGGAAHLPCQTNIAQPEGSALSAALRPLARQPWRSEYDFPPERVVRLDGGAEARTVRSGRLCEGHLRRTMNNSRRMRTYTERTASPLEYALTKSLNLKSPGMSSYKKDPGGGAFSPPRPSSLAKRGVFAELSL